MSKKYKKHTSRVNETKNSFKGTPQRYIDFKSYLNSTKVDKNKNSNLSVSTLSKSDPWKHSSLSSSIEKTRKKYGSKVKAKKAPISINVRLHDYKPEEYVKHLKQINLDPRTPKIMAESSGKLTSKVGSSHKKSYANIKDKQFSNITNSSFCFKKIKPSRQKLSVKKRSSSSSPDIRKVVSKQKSKIRK